ncbi:MAG TPA: serine/threonine protein kinase [Acidobacteria bacterium]|nr:serine/threonine protein kinase [Acidobacteriota bacterium]
MNSSSRPRTFGRYRVVRLLGRGAVGEVYLAEDPALSRRVAVKTLSGLDALPPAEQEEARARFLREARAAAALSHPNIVTIFDVGEQDGQPYMAMEYLEGASVDRYVAEGHRLPAVKVVEIGMQAALALDEAHRAGIVHRDIKPANLVLMQDGSLKVADFGLAKDLRTSLTSAQTLLGTPNYMSPEQVAGAPLDTRSDLFSLAVCLFELLTGRRPFGGDTVSTVLYRIVNDPPTPLRELREDLPERLEALLARCLEKDPARRPATGNEVAHELREVLTEMGGLPASLSIPAPARVVPAGPAGGSEQKGSPTTARRGRRWRPLVGLGLLLATVAAAWTLPLWSGVDPLGQRRRPVEDWLSARLGVVGDAVRLTIPEKVLPLLTQPRGLAVVVDDPRVRLDADRRLHFPGDLEDSFTLRVDDACRTGRVEVDPRTVAAPLVIETEPRRQTFEVVSSPPRARVKLDGRQIEGRTPLELEIELCREHSLSLRVSGRPELEVTLAADQAPEVWSTRLAALKMPRLEDAFLEVAASPHYKVMVLDARRGGRLGSAGKRLRLRPGRHRLALVAEKVFYRREIDVALEPGQRMTLPMAYPALGRLSVISVPPEAEVTVSSLDSGLERKIGRTPTGERKVVVGEYAVEVIHPVSGKPFREKIRVRAGTATVVRAGKGRGGW